jgi:hypothetical protein
MVAFGFDEAGVEVGELGIDWSEGGGEDLEFFAASALDQGAADEVINGLIPLAVADGAHEAGNPRAGERLAKGNAASLEEAEDELEMLEFLDGDGVEFFDTGKEVAIFFEVERAGGGLAFEVGVIHKDSANV